MRHQFAQRCIQLCNNVVRVPFYSFVVAPGFWRMTVVIRTLHELGLCGKLKFMRAELPCICATCSCVFIPTTSKDCLIPMSSAFCQSTSVGFPFHIKNEIRKTAVFSQNNVIANKPNIVLIQIYIFYIHILNRGQYISLQFLYNVDKISPLQSCRPHGQRFYESTLHKAIDDSLATLTCCKRQVPLPI